MGEIYFWAVNRVVLIPDSEIEMSTIPSAGAIGQNVNKVASAIHIRRVILI
ncbi:MAG: hypothetical protein SAK29_26980 [Scytonema sp. PMC 1069.18]|nr:hypothetical protein [Scytonema sp. PMC 1069.18]MEC4885447.1 hypothetical protein [Scytonema sp. PMC 1070.18]